MSKTSPILAAALAGLGSLLAACASDRPPPGPPPGAAGEAPRPRARLFVSPAGQPFRARAGGEDPLDAWWRQVDKNGDGVVTVDELRADFTSFFKVLDRDGDGVVDGFEVSIYENDMVPELIPDVGPRDRLGEPVRQGGAPRMGRGGGGRRRGGDFGAPPGFGAGPGGGGQGAAYASLTRDPEPVMAADYDLSHKITAAEFERRAEEVFALLDLDHDGKLTREELPKPPEPGQGRRAGRRGGG